MDEVAEKRKEKGIKLSPEDKDKLMGKWSRKHSRKNMMPKGISIHALSKKMGRYRDELSLVQKDNADIKAMMDDILTRIEFLFDLPVIQKAIEEIKLLQEQEDEAD